MLARRAHNPAMARVLKWVVAALVLLALLVLGMAFALHRWVNTDDFRGRVEREASAAIGVPVKLGALSVDVWPLPAVAVEKLRLQSQPPVTLERVEARPVWQALLQGRLEVATLIVRDAVLPAQGISAIAAAFQKRTPPGNDSERAFYLDCLGHGCCQLRQRAGGAALFGTQKERSDSFLMKSMICLASGLAENMLSTSSSRSFSVPSLENSMR